MKHDMLTEEDEETKEPSAFENEGGLDLPANGQTEFPLAEAMPKQFRRLKRNELVSVGDFVSDNKKGFELWEGPSGFQAGSFIKPIYRLAANGSPAAKK